MIERFGAELKRFRAVDRRIGTATPGSGSPLAPALRNPLAFGVPEPVMIGQP